MSQYSDWSAHWFEMLPFYDSARLHTSAHTTEVIKRFGLTVLVHPPHSPGLTTSHYHLFGPMKASCRETIMPMTESCRTPCISGCTGGTAPFTGLVYMFLFKSGKRMPTKMKTKQKNNYAFGHDVVEFCEIFPCPTCK